MVDGYGTRMLPGGKTPNRQGLKVFVFAREPVDDLGKLLSLLPLRQKTRKPARPAKK